MASDIIFIPGSSLRAIGDREERRKIRSEILKRAWKWQSGGPRQYVEQPKSSERDADINDQAVNSQDVVMGSSGTQTQTNILRAIGGINDPCAPTSFLSASRSDPFMSFGLDPHDSLRQGILDYCVHDLWPGFRPDKVYAGEFATCWLTKAAQNPVVMSAILFSASAHRNMRMVANQSPAELTQTEYYLNLKGSAIRTLRENMSEAIGPEHIDEMIYAILCLAASQHAPPSFRRSAERNNFQPVEIESQWVTVYGNVEFDPTHFNAIVALVRHIGSIEKIRTYSVGWLVFFAGLLDAARSVTPPLFPPVDVYGHLYDYQSPLRLLRIFEPPVHFITPGGGFHVFEKMSAAADVIQTLLDFSEYSQAMDVLSTRPANNRVIVSILDSRSHLVYRVLSLPTLMQEDSGEYPSSHTAEQANEALILYSCARLVVQLYTLHVIFPIPCTSSVRGILIPAIRAKVAYFDEHMRTMNDKGPLELLAWACTIAAIASSADESVDEAWFVWRLKLLVRKLGIGSYEEFKKVLRLFGWIDASCDRYGSIIWSGYSVAETLR